MAAPRSPAIIAAELLRSREERAARQAIALAKFGKPLLSVTIVMPGPVKDGPVPRRAIDVALQEISVLLGERRWPLLWGQVLYRNTGPEAVYVVDAPSEVLKSVAIELEERHPMGRLWDIDVVASSGTPLSRAQLGMPARHCLVCSQPARECGRWRRHSLRQLLNTIGTMVNDFEKHSRT